MKYYVSTISDVVTAERDDGWENLSYIERTAPLAAANSLGIEIAEFCITSNMDETFADVLPHVEACAAAVADKTLHAPYNELLPMAIDRKVAAVAYERYDESWRYCLRFGAKKLIVHANYYSDMYYSSWFTQRQSEFWRRFLGEHGEDIVVCLENVMELEPDEILEVIEKVKDPRLKMCLDVGHANLTELPPIEWLRRSALAVSHYHIHNNNGAPKEGRRSWGDKHAALDNGNIDMLALLREAEKLSPEATAAIESYEPERSVSWLKEQGII